MRSVVARDSQVLPLAPGQEVATELANAPAIGFDFGEIGGCSTSEAMQEQARLQRQHVRRSTHIVAHLLPREVPTGGAGAPVWKTRTTARQGAPRSR